MAEAKLKEKPDKENVKEALNATVEIMSSTMDTGGKYVTNRRVGDGTLIWIPDDELETEPYNPDGEEEIESAVEECMGSDGLEVGSVRLQDPMFQRKSLK